MGAKARIDAQQEAAAGGVDFFSAYVALYQPGTEYGPALAPCPRCECWALPCDMGCEAQECPGCGSRCAHAPPTEEDSPFVQALRGALLIWRSAAFSTGMGSLLTVLFRAANRVQLTAAESAAMWSRVDAANAGPLASATLMSREAGIDLLTRAIRGEMKP